MSKYKVITHYVSCYTYIVEEESFDSAKLNYSDGKCIDSYFDDEYVLSIEAIEDEEEE